MYRLALIVRRPCAPRFTLLLRPCPRPSSSSTTQEHDVDDEDDAPLFDLPSSSFTLASDDYVTCPFALLVQYALHSIGITHYNAADSVSQLKAQLLSIWDLMEPWVYWKFVEEPEYGPGPPVHTIFFMTNLNMEGALPIGTGQWFDFRDAWALLMAGGTKGVLRVGPMAAYAFSPHFPQGLKHKLKLTMKSQEYPPGVLLIPLTSSTQKPFSKTNLVVFASKSTAEKNTLPVVRGEALIVDPGCHPMDAQKQLSGVVKALPKNLVVFLTHHHVDHTEGLPTVYEQNPEAIVLAHELTIHRLGKVKEAHG